MEKKCTLEYQINVQFEINSRNIIALLTIKNKGDWCQDGLEARLQTLLTSRVHGSNLIAGNIYLIATIASYIDKDFPNLNHSKN